MSDIPPNKAGVHPDLTAFRAVDACGGTYSPEEEASGYAAGHKAALDAACEAVKAADALIAELLAAARFAKDAMEALDGYEADYGEPLDEMHEIGRIPESRATPSFRLRVGHIRRLVAAATKAHGGSCERSRPRPAQPGEGLEDAAQHREGGSHGPAREGAWPSGQKPTETMTHPTKEPGDAN